MVLHANKKKKKDKLLNGSSICKGRGLPLCLFESNEIVQQQKPLLKQSALTLNMRNQLCVESRCMHQNLRTVKALLLL